MNQLIALDRYASPDVERAKLEQEWEQFIAGVTAKPAIRPLMYESWKRCLDQNIDPLHNKAAISLSKEQIEDYVNTSPLYHTLRPHLLKLREMSVDSDHLITFCNSAGDIVYMDGDLSLMLKAEDMNFVVGSSWAENKAGTNAIGISLVTGDPIQVFAGEHFCQEVQKWTCSAAPIRDPATGNILGALDLTGLWRVNHPDSLTVIASAAQNVERHLHNHLIHERNRLIEYYSQLRSSGFTTPVLVLDRGCNVVKGSPLLFEHGWIDSHHRVVGLPSAATRIIARRQWEIEHRTGTWRFELTPYIYGGHAIGAVVYALPPSSKNAKLPQVDHSVRPASPANGGELLSVRQFMKNEQFYESLFEHNPSAILCFDLKGNVLCANPTAEKTFGYTVEELRSIDISSLVLSGHAEKSIHHFINTIKGKPQDFEIAVRHKDGHILAVSVRSFPMFADNKIIGAYGIAKDITLTKQIEEDLKSTKEQLELFLKNSVDSVVVLDRQFKVIKVNRTFENMFGWTEQEVIGGELPTIPAYLIEDFMSLQREIVRNRHVTSYETVRQRRDGSLLDTSIYISPLSDTKGNVVAFVAILRDITERKKMEDALKEKEKQLRTLINAMPEAVCFKDGEGRWIEANDCCLQTFQLQDLPYQGKRDSELAALNPFYETALLQCEESDRRAWEGGRTVRLEEITPLPNGEAKVFDVSKVPLFDPDGSRKGLVVISRDITELKRTEELLRKSEKLSVVGQLAAGVAHEIRNPLTAIRGFIQFLQEGQQKEEYFQVILSELDRIQSVVNEFLVLAKPQAIDFKPRNLSSLLHQVIDLLGTEAIMNNVQITSAFDTQIPLVNGGENQLKQLFINILKNAIEAMPNGGVITVQLMARNEAVLIRIIDQGDGIAEDRIKNLGEPFYTTKEKGTGLGLTISYKIVQAHQGSMTISSQKNRGTTVEIMFPAI